LNKFELGFFLPMVGDPPGKFDWPQQRWDALYKQAMWAKHPDGWGEWAQQRDHALPVPTMVQESSVAALLEGER